MLFAGAGASAQGIPDLIVAAMTAEGLSRTEAIRRIYMVDSRFEFWDPARWWMTPRIRLSPIVFRTRSVDSLQLVYRISRVGMRPEQDPSLEPGRSICEFG